MNIHHTSLRKIRILLAVFSEWPSGKVGFDISIVSMEECKTKSYTDVINEYKPYKKKELWKRLESNVCEYCGTKSENPCRIFTIRRLKELRDEPWAEPMRAMRRKTLVVCPTCYNLILYSRSIKRND